MPASISTRPRSILAALLAAGMLFACSSRAPRRSEVRDTDRLTAVEIEGTGVANAYEAIARLRPQYLRSRSTTTARSRTRLTPVVYLDDSRLGGLAELRTISIGQVLEIRYINASDATTRWGTNHGGGAIQVITKLRR